MLARELGAVVALGAVAIDERPLLRRAFRDACGSPNGLQRGEHADGREHARAAQRVDKCCRSIGSVSR